MPRLSIRRKKRPKVSAVPKTVFAAPTSGISFPAGCLASLGRRGGACPRPLSARRPLQRKAHYVGAGLVPAHKGRPYGCRVLWAGPPEAKKCPAVRRRTTGHLYIIKGETAGSGRFGRERALFYSFVTNAPEVLTFCERCFIMRTEARGVVLD